MNLQKLSAAVQSNCHISDARHGTEYSMCAYLLKMREYYRWEKGLPFAAQLPNDELGDWLTAREHLWRGLDVEEFSPLELGGECFNPFDTEAINQWLAPRGLVYSGGLGHNVRPHFFLGELDRVRKPSGCTVWISDREYARDLTAPPAMSQGNSIFIRRESLRRLLWEKLENWRWSRRDSPIGRAFAGYQLDRGVDASLDSMAERELDTLLFHEIGEARIGQQLGADWNEMLLALANTPAERTARAVRDLWADCLSTLPRLLETAEPASIHFFVGNLTAMAQEIFPGLLRAYRLWAESCDIRVLQEAARDGCDHWGEIAVRMLDIYRSRGVAAAADIGGLAKGIRL